MREALLELYREVGGATPRVISEYADPDAPVGKTWIYQLGSSIDRVPQLATVEAFLTALKEYHDRPGNPPQRQRASIPPERFTTEWLSERFPDEYATLLGARPQDVSKPKPLDERLISGHREYVRAFVPAGGLVGRQAELARLAEFCCGEQPYLWMQAPAYAGKTALLATFAANPPEGVEVVSFFVIGRLAGQSDSRAFVDSVLDQLVSLSGSWPAGIDAADARDGRMLAMLKDLAVRRADAGRQLVLVVDGIDEDRSAQGPEPRHSIGRLLPREPFRGLAVIVSSRSDRPLPLDVPADHPLETAPVLELSKFDRSDEFHREAKLELNALLAGPALQQDLVGLVVAAGGPLTVTDLEELTGGPRYEIERILEGADGRSFRSDPAPPLDGVTPSDRSYLLAHDSLHHVAEESVGSRGLAGYRHRVHTWAEECANRGWPQETSAYLLNHYPQLLSVIGDTRRLSRLVLDPVRRERLFEATGGDHAALVEMELCRAMLTAVNEPDLEKLMVWSMHREHVAIRNAHIPSELTLIWFQLGHRQRALSIARSLLEVDRSVGPLASISAELARTGDHGGAQTILDSLPLVEPEDVAPPGQRAWAFIRVAAAMVEVGEVAKAEALLRKLPSEVHTKCIAHLAKQVAEAGHVAAAETLLVSVADPVHRLDVLISIAQAAAERSDSLAVGLAQRAFETARVLEGLPHRSSTLVSIAETTALNGTPIDAILDAAEEALEEAEAEDRDNILADIATLAADHGDLDRAARVLTAISTEYARTNAERALLYAAAVRDREAPLGRNGGNVDVVVAAALIVNAAASDDYDRVAELADLIIASPGYFPLLFDAKRVITAVAAGGDFDRAVALAAAMSPTRKLPDYRVGPLAAAAARAGDWQRATDLARRWIGKEQFGHSVLRELLPALTEARGFDVAAEFVSEVASPVERAKGFAILARLALDAGALGHADRYAQRSEREARNVGRPPEHIRGVLRLADKVMRAGGRLGTARALVTLTSEQDAGASAVVLGRIVVAADETGFDQVARDAANDLERAVDAVEPADRRTVVEDLASSLAVSTALRFAQADPDPGSRLDLLATVCTSSKSEAARAVQADIVAAADSAIAAVVEPSQPGGAPAQNGPEDDALVVRWIPASWQPFSSYAAVLIGTIGDGAAREALHAFDGSWSDKARCGLAHALVQAGRIDLALNEVGDIDEAELRDRARQAIAGGLSEARDPERALAVIDGIEDRRIRDGARQTLVAASVAGHDAALAATVAESVEDGSLRAQSLTVAALALKETKPADARRLLRAAQRATTAPTSGWSGRCSPIAGVAEAWMACGGVAEALDIASRLEWRDLMYAAPSIIDVGGEEAAAALGDIVESGVRSPLDFPSESVFRPEAFEAIARHGLRTRMETFVTSTMRPAAFHPGPSEWLALSAARRGDHAAAMAIADGFRQRARRACVLLGASEGAEEQAMRVNFLAEAIASDPWTALPVLLKRSHGSVVELADAYLALWGR